MITLTTRTIEKPKSSPILRRTATKDRTAVEDFTETHGNFIRELTYRFTDSPEEAEAATQEIFLDVWRHSRNAGRPLHKEGNLIALIAERRLLQRLQIRREKIYDEYR